VDYRKYLKDYCQYKRESSNFKFTLKEISTRAGFANSSYLSLLIDGKRNLSSESAQNLAQGLGLRTQESDFFVTLVQFAQAPDLESKTKSFERLKSFRHFRAAQKDLPHRYKYFSRWYFAAILAALQNEDWRKKSLNQQAADLKIQAPELERAFHSLKALGMVKEFKGIWSPTQSSYRSPDELQSLFVGNFYVEMLQKAMEAHNLLSSAERKMGSMTIGLSESQYELASKRLYQFLDDLHAILDSSKEPAKKVYQMNFQLFPLLDLRLNKV